MIILGQAVLLMAFLACGSGGCLSYLAARGGRPWVQRGAVVSLAAAFAALTLAIVVLAQALLRKDFHFAYVAEYSHQQLPWYYSLSALWVGQEGSMLLWTWLLALVTAVFVAQARQLNDRLRYISQAVLMAYLCYLLAIIVFAADPLKPSLTSSVEGMGLSPLLMHPAMLIHPPIVFLGYAAWGIPFALAIAALTDPTGDTHWLRLARSWTLFAWTVLGAGIILGGNWAYEELGWGGYWAWDPVENGSLLPWLTGTALIHALLGWHYRGVLKRTTIAFALTTFILCNFATFLTRSGLFSSLHAFSRSPIGWAFLAMMAGLSLYGATMLYRERTRLAPDRPIRSVWSREAFIATGALGLLLLAIVTLVGTLMVPLSDLILGQKIVVGMAFFNNVFLPIGLLLLGSSGAAPLLRWGAPPSRRQRYAMLASAAVGCLTVVIAVLGGQRNAVTLTAFACAGFAVAAFVSVWWLDAGRNPISRPLSMLHVLLQRRPIYAGYVMHLAFAVLLVGIIGSSLGTVRNDISLRVGESVQWHDYTVRLASVHETPQADIIVAGAELEFTQHDRHICTLQPSQHYHTRQKEWTTEVAIHSAWSSDVYTILHGAGGVDTAELTLVFNPLVRWIWLGGWLFCLSTLVRLWPVRVEATSSTPLSRPKFLSHRSGRRERARAR
jgi:cytochrome c-type biogenesis protein CcmF